MKLAGVVLVLGACHGGKSQSSCTAKLADLATFYDAVAADNARPEPPSALRMAEMEAGFEELPLAAGAAADLSKADVLVVGTIGIELISASGERGHLVTGDMWGVELPDPASQLVLFIDERVPWQKVEDVRQHLKTATGYASIGVAYRSKGALAGRTPPKLPGADDSHLDIVTIGTALAKTTAAHCPEYAKQLAALQTSGHLDDSELLRSLGRTIPHCDCDVDLALLEAFPWLVARPAVTVVPVSSSAPPLHGADSATWGDLVRDAKGPVPMPPPPPLPPRPPPPPPRRR
jgi:hypothetical protein